MMAAKDATQPSTGKRPRRYYRPTPINRNAPGVTWRQLDERTDEYRGTAEALAAAGVLQLECFPGMPGQAVVSGAYHPIGADYDRWPTDAPGYQQVHRLPSGGYRVVRNVERDERDRRLADARAVEAGRRAAQERVLDELPQGLRSWLNGLVDTLGGRREVRKIFCDAAWLAKIGINAVDRRRVLAGLEVFELADVEFEMVGHSLGDARAVLARVAGRQAR